MDVKELLEKKEQLENHLADYIAGKVNLFLVESEVGIESFDVILTDLREMGTDKSVLTLVAVDISLDI